MIDKFTIEVERPAWARWVATDANGQRWYYENKPKKGTVTWDALGGNVWKISEGSFCRDWQESLHELSPNTALGDDVPEEVPEVDDPNAPDGARWRAENAYGEYLYFENKPGTTMDGDCWVSFNGCVWRFPAPAQRDWRESLVKIKRKVDVSIPIETPASVTRRAELEKLWNEIREETDADMKGDLFDRADRDFVSLHRFIVAALCQDADRRPKTP